MFTAKDTMQGALPKLVRQNSNFILKLPGISISLNKTRYQFMFRNCWAFEQNAGAWKSKVTTAVGTSCNQFIEQLRLRNSLLISSKHIPSAIPYSLGRSLGRLLVVNCPCTEEWMTTYRSTSSTASGTVICSMCLHSCSRIVSQWGTVSPRFRRSPRPRETKLSCGSQTNEDLLDSWTVLHLVISCSTATPCYTNKAALQLASLTSEMLTPLLSQSKPMYLAAQGARACESQKSKEIWNTHQFKLTMCVTTKYSTCSGFFG